MKKTKIASIALGATALVGLTVATPFILSSCSSTITSDALIGKEFLQLIPGAYKCELNREENTNNFTLTTLSPTWKYDVLEQIRINSEQLLTKEQLLDLKFSEQAIEPQENSTSFLMVMPGLVDKYGKTRYPGFEVIKDVDFDLKSENNQEKVVYNTIKIAQINVEKMASYLPEDKEQELTQEQIVKAYTKSTEHDVILSFKLTVKPTK